MSNFLPKLHTDVKPRADVSSVSKPSAALPSLKAAVASTAHAPPPLFQKPIRVSKADDSYSMRHTVLEIKNDFLPRRNFDSEKRHHFTPKQTRSYGPANHSFYANPLPKLSNHPMVHFEASPQHANEYARDDESKKSLLAYGRTTKFTTGFVNHIMFSDNSIVAATNHKMRLENSIMRMKDREQKKIHKLETL